MESSDEEFFKQLLETFKIEAEDHISSLTNNLLELEKNFDTPSTDDKLQTIYRNAHSLKGAARAVNLEIIQNICQEFENVLSALKDKKIKPSKELFQVCFEVLDYIKELVQKPQEKPESSDVYKGFIDRLNKLVNDSPEKTKQEDKSEEIKKEEPKVEEINQPSAPPASEQPQKEEKSPDINNKASPSQTVDKKEEIKEPLKTEKQKLLKISSEKLDALIREIEELQLIRLLYKELQNKVSLLCEPLKKSEKFESSIDIEKLPIKDSIKKNTKSIFSKALKRCDQTIISIQTQLEEIQKILFRDKYVVDTTVSSILYISRKLIMQPFATILEVFPRMVRDISMQLKKEINFEIHGKNVEIDRRILEELKDPLMHMVRNSIDHGIETPDIREKANKDKTGSIKIEISQVGDNHIDIVLKDDGKGFPLEKIKTKALSSGKITSEQASNMKKEDIISLCFASGVSSVDIITELSGRGLGLGILQDKIEKLGGSFEVQTEEGKGSTFNLQIPLTTATFRGIEILCNDKIFFIPNQNVKKILKKNEYELSTIENQQVLFFKGKNYPYRVLSELLHLNSNTQTSEKLVLLLVAGGLELAIGVDKIIKEEEVFVKALGSQLTHVPNISAGTIIEGNEVILILNVLDLIKTARNIISKKEKDVAALKEEDKKVVLIAEDAMTTRLLFKNILESAGYIVLSASDGAKALEIMQKQHVDLLITDLEMPNMNGFELVENLKKEGKTKDIPIIIITAKDSPEDKKRGIQLGVEAYIEKSSFLQKELVSIIQQLI